MKKNEIFTQRERLGGQILQFIKGEGYTKSSFAKMIGLSRPTLNQIIEGKTPNETTFNTQINKILNSIGMQIEDLMNYKNNNTETMNTVYSDNLPKNHSMSKSAVDTLDILDNILDLYEIYYK